MFNVKMPAGIKINKVQQLSEDQNTSRENTHLNLEIVVLVSDFGELFDNNPRTIASRIQSGCSSQGERVPKVFPVQPLPFSMKAAAEAELKR